MCHTVYADGGATARTHQSAQSQLAVRTGVFQRATVNRSERAALFVCDAQRIPPWSRLFLMTPVDQILGYYARSRKSLYELQYNAASAYKGNKVFIFSNNVVVPRNSALPYMATALKGGEPVGAGLVSLGRLRPTPYPGEGLRIRPQDVDHLASVLPRRLCCGQVTCTYSG